MTATNKSTVAAFSKRFQELSSVVTGDKTADKLLKNLTSAIKHYRDTVSSMLSTLSIQRFRLEGEELRELTERLDRNRHNAHECLIDAVCIANRYLLKKYHSDIPEGGVYTWPVSHLMMKDRNAIGEWALQVAPALQ